MYTGKLTCIQTKEVDLNLNASLFSSNVSLFFSHRNHKIHPLLHMGPRQPKSVLPRNRQAGVLCCIQHMFWADWFKAKGNFSPYPRESKCSSNSTIRMCATSGGATKLSSQGLAKAAWKLGQDLAKVLDPGPASSFPHLETSTVRPPHPRMPMYNSNVLKKHYFLYFVHF